MNISEHDLVQLLAAGRPSDDDLASSWPAEERAALWTRINDDGPSEVLTSRHPRRTALRIAAAVIVAGIALPTVLTSGGASARAELLQLALVAGQSDAPVIDPGTYLHVKTESLQENSRVFGDGQRLDTDREQWIRWDGQVWAIDTRPSAGWTEYHQFDAPAEVGFGDPTPEFVASLPDDPTTFRDYLDDTVSGSNSHEEALFIAIRDLVGSRMLDPATFGVALQVLADVDGVDTRDVMIEGRDAVEVNYDTLFGIGLLGRQSFTVDRETAQVLTVAESDPGGTYQSETTLIEVVETIPDTVLEKYDVYDNGARICANGRESTGDGDCPTT